tara:strand:- start:4694 stop:5119 length:426 start_codon:yes stop_codon:yes gene_type:complete
MSELKDEIRNVLRQELMLIQQEFKSIKPRVEHVNINSSDELMDFVRELLNRAEERNFVDQIKEGGLRFEISEKVKTGNLKSDPNLNVRKQASISKMLITERDIGNLKASEKTISIWKSSRLTPLARDEIRRRGISIERIET